MLHVRPQPTGRDGLDSLIELAVRESREKRAGSRSVLLRLGELMFVEVVRRYLTTLTTEEGGWLSGLRDPLVGRALARLHAQPSTPWTLEMLAREIATSRSVLAERFTHFVGEPPMHYLTRWRIQLAAGMLADGATKVATVARDVGYDSEAAFSRAFKKLTGVAPAAWRDRRHFS
jgi:AraC-like DNA-binding protein